MGRSSLKERSGGDYRNFENRWRLRQPNPLSDRVFISPLAIFIGPLTVRLFCTKRTVEQRDKKGLIDHIPARLHST